MQGSSDLPTVFVAQHFKVPISFLPTGYMSLVWLSVNVEVLCLRVSSIPLLLRTHRKVVALGMPWQSHGIRLVEALDTATVIGDEWTQRGLSENIGLNLVLCTNKLHTFDLQILTVTWGVTLNIRSCTGVLASCHGCHLLENKSRAADNHPLCQVLFHSDFLEENNCKILERAVNKVQYRGKLSNIS